MVICVDKEKDFRRRRCAFSFDTLSKKEVLELLKNSQVDFFRYQDKKHLKIMLHPKLLLFTGNIRENQVYRTPQTDGYHHIYWESSPHYEVYFKVDHEQKTISFLLGTYYKSVKIQEHTVYAYKLQGDRVLCTTTEQLEEAMLSSVKRRFGIDLGRKALQIKEIV